MFLLSHPLYSFPEQDFFREQAIQKMMADVLFVWSKENSDVSYRQGMHELLALVFFVVYHDKIPALKEAQNEEEYTPRSPALLFFFYLFKPWLTFLVFCLAGARLTR